MTPSNKSPGSNLPVGNPQPCNPQFSNDGEKAHIDTKLYNNIKYVSRKMLQSEEKIVHLRVLNN